MRKPDEVIGSPDDPYMERWILFQPSRFKRVVTFVREGAKKVLKFDSVRKTKQFLPSVYLHEFKRSDDDRHFHDHVAWSISIVLRGGYWELIPRMAHDAIDRNPQAVAYVRRIWRWRGPGSIVFRRALQPHIIVLDRLWRVGRQGQHIPVAMRYPMHGKRILSLWIRGPWRREWGFYTEGGWVPWDEYVNRGEYRYKSKQ